MSKGSWQMPILRAWLQHPLAVACQPRAAPEARGKGAPKEPTEGLTTLGWGWLHRRHRCPLVPEAVLGSAQATAGPVPRIHA